MTIDKPVLKLIFLEDDTVRYIENDFIVTDSISFSEQLLNGIESSSNNASLQVARKCPAIWNNIDDNAKVISTDCDIQAILYDAHSYQQEAQWTKLFTGYLNEKISWTVTKNGEQAVNLTLEDVGTRLLPKAFIKSGLKTYLDETASEAIEDICDAAGITLDSSIPTISTNVCRVINTGTTCQDLLKSLVKELGYVYYFTNTGKLNLKKIDCTSIVGIPEYNKNHLYNVDGNALILSKQMRQYKSAKVSYDSHNTTTEKSYVYKDISGQDDTHPDCYIEIASGGTYPDTTGYNDSFVNATDLSNGKDIVYISAVEGEFAKDPSSASFSYVIEQYGIDTLNVKVRNNSASTAHITKLQAKATIKYIDAQNIVIAGETAADDESDNVLETECEWLHDKTSADTYARLLVDYYKHCNKQFIFYASSVINTGSIVKITDNQFSGLSNAVLITAKDYSDHTDICKYTAVSIAPFEKTAIPITENKTYAPPTKIYSKPGQQGAPGESALVFNITTDKATFERDLKYGGTQTITITAHIQGYEATTCSLSTTYGTLSKSSGIVDGEEVTLTVTKYQNSNDTITLTATLTDAPNSEVILSVVNMVYERKSYGYSTSLLNDAVYVSTDDTTVTPGKTYYTIVDGIGVPVVNPTGDPSAQNWYELDYHYIEGDSYVLQETTTDGGILSTIYKYGYNASTGLYQWDILTSDYNLFDALVTENISNVFANAGSVNNIQITQGDNLYDVYKYLIAQKISAVKYYIGTNGCIYSGCYDENGNRTSEDAYGFYVSSRGQLKAYNTEIVDITATNLTVNNIDARGGEINVGKVSAGDCNIRGTLNMDNGTIDIGVLTTYDDNLQSTFNANPSRDLYSGSTLYNSLSPNNTPFFTTFSSGNSVIIDGVTYTQYAKQTTDMSVFSHGSNTRSVTGDRSIYSGSASGLASTLGISVDWSNNNRNFLTLHCGNNYGYHIEINSDGGQSSSDYYLYDSGNDKCCFRGWVKSSDNITVYRSGGNNKKTGIFRASFNQNYREGFKYTKTKMIGCSDISWLVTPGRVAVPTITVPAGVTNLVLYYSEGFANVTRTRSGAANKTYRIGSYSYQTYYDEEGDPYYQLTVSRDFVNQGGGALSIDVIPGDVITFSGVGSGDTGDNGAVYLKHFQYCFYYNDGNYLLLKNSDGSACTALDPSYSDSRDYFTGSSTVISASKTSTNALYASLRANGINNNVTYDLSGGSTITVNGTTVEIDKLQISEDQSGYIGYRNLSGVWTFLNALGYNYGGYYNSLSAHIIATTGTPRIATKSVVPKNSQSTIGFSSDPWSQVYADNIRLTRQQNNLPAIYTSTSAPTAAVGSVGDLWFTYSN